MPPALALLLGGGVMTFVDPQVSPGVIMTQLPYEPIVIEMQKLTREKSTCQSVGCAS